MSVSSARCIKHPRSIAIVNYKGGVGKTTVTYLLGLYVALQTGRRVLLLDIDAQCSLTLAAGVDPDQSTLSGKNIYEIVRPEAWGGLAKLRLSDYVQPVPGLPTPLYLIPGGFKVEDLDIEIVETIAAKRERSKDEFFLYCRQLLYAMDDYEYVLVDCPPNKMYLTQAMLRACRFYLPVTIPDRISIYGMPRLKRWVDAIEPNEKPLMLGYVLNGINRTGGAAGGKVLSQQAAENFLVGELKKGLSHCEDTVMRGIPSLGGIPRLDAVAKFLGDQKAVQLDFSRKTSGQPTIDECLNKIAKSAVERMNRFNA